MTKTTDKKECRHQFIEVGGNCVICGESSITTTDKKEWEKVYVRFEKLAKRLKKEGRELDANEFWKFLILELFQQRQELKKKVEELGKKGKALAVSNGSGAAGSTGGGYKGGGGVGGS